MIDIESKVFTTVRNAVLADTSFSSATVAGEYIDVPTSFPCVTIVEADNYTVGEFQDERLTDHDVQVMYEVNVYSNKKDTKKSEAKKLAKIVDTAMLGMNFNRTECGQTPNIDRTVYRITMRYEALIHLVDATHFRVCQV